MNSASIPLILHVIHHLRTGGLENGLVNLINRLPAGQFRHVVICIEDYSEFRNRISRSDVEVIALHRSQIGVWRLRWEIFRLCRQLRPSIIHTRNLSGLDALLPARLAGVSMSVHSEHGWDVDNLDGSKQKPLWLRRLHVPLINRYIAVSRDLQAYLQKRVGIAGKKVTQIYNGVDTLRFVPSDSACLDWLPVGFREPGLMRIGTVGRLQAIKDQASLLHAVAGLVERKPHLRVSVRLIVVGDGPLRQELQTLAEQLHINEICYFSGDRNDIPGVLQSLNLFVLPSLNEGISNTLLEAMATGLPVLATAAGGNVELIDDGHSGSLFAPGDIQGLLKLLEHYVLNPELRDKHSKIVRQRAVEDFSLDAMMLNYTRVYQQLLEGEKFSRS